MIFLLFFLYDVVYISQDVLGGRASVMNSQEIDRLQGERRRLQDEVRHERNILDNLKKERIDLESDVRKVRISKDTMEKKMG